MAHQSMRVNLASVIFPLTKELWGRSIIVPQYDENYERGAFAGSTADIGKDKGVPMACYLHNCMPTSEGYQSIGFTKVASGLGGVTNFDRVFQLLQSAPQSANFLWSPSMGSNYVYDGTVGAWQSDTPIGTPVANTVVTTAYVAGQSYVFYSGIGCFAYNSATRTMDPVALTGLTIADITGITSSFGYLIAYGPSALAWSSTTDPLDFTPSLITGAGGGNVNDIKGSIIYAVGMAGGFLLFCERNVVAAKYTGNIRFPFIFKAIPGSGGIEAQDQVAVPADDIAEIYAYTDNGLQVYTITSCDNAFPEASDFLSKLIFEDFDDTTLVFTETNLSSQLNVKMAIIASRFLVVSYGQPSAAPNFTHAIIYDAALKRWGKVKLTHRCAFEWNFPNLFGSVTYGDLIAQTYGSLVTTTYGDFLTSTSNSNPPLKNLAFVQADGTTYTMNFDLSEATANGTILLGKFQFQRNRFITHQFSDFENVVTGQNFSVFLLPTLDGKTMLTPIPAIRNRLSPNAQRWAKRVTGQNYSLLMQGAFNMTTIITDFTLQGDR